MASEFLDLLSFGFLAVGLEEMGSYEVRLDHGLRILDPGSVSWSHSLFMSIVWSILAGLVAYLIFKDCRSGLILGVVVLSHWMLDFIVHASDLPLLY